MVDYQSGQVRVRTSGAVPPDMPELARRRVETVLRHVGEPVLLASVVLAVAADPAVEWPAIAWVTVSVNGRVVRAHAMGATMPEAIGALAGRLRIRLERTWPDKDRHRRRPQASVRRIRHGA